VRESANNRRSSTSAVRGLAAKDLDAVMAILAEAPEAAIWTREGFLDSLEDAGSIALVVETGVRILGFLIGRQVRDQAEVLNLAISHSERRQGLGTQLLDAALEEFRSRGAQTAYLEVRESNTAAIAFYERHGFAKVGRRRGYYQEPAEAAVTMMRKFTG
jgi:ribosomal-protein-alanine acetyltransferase